MKGLLGHQSCSREGMTLVNPEQSLVYQTITNLPGSVKNIFKIFLFFVVQTKRGSCWKAVSEPGWGKIAAADRL
jgi:hypothetical protein